MLTPEMGAIRLFIEYLQSQHIKQGMETGETI